MLCPGEGSTLPEKNPLSSHWLLTHRSLLSDHSEQFTHTGEIQALFPAVAMVGLGVRSGMEGREPEGQGELGFISVTGKTLRYCIAETALWSG